MMEFTFTFSNCVGVTFSLKHNQDLTQATVEYTIVSESDSCTIKIPNLETSDTIILKRNGSSLVNLENIHINYLSFKDIIIKDSEFWQVMDYTGNQIGEQVITIGPQDTCKLTVPKSMYARYVDRIVLNASDRHQYLSNIRPFD